MGGGTGYVKNITYERFYNYNNDWALEVNQWYGVSNRSVCQEYPVSFFCFLRIGQPANFVQSKMVMSDVYFLDMRGTASKKNDPKVGTLVCSASEVCLNFNAYNAIVTPPSGKAPTWVRSGLDTSKLESFSCVFLGCYSSVLLLLGNIML